MILPTDEIFQALAQFNPWWKAEPIFTLPKWQRASFDELFEWVNNPPAARAVLLSGARQVGKTTLLLQTIQKLLAKHIPPANILYITFDHPIIKLAGIDAILQAWREREPKLAGPEYLFLDEAQFIPDWAVWIKHQVDFVKDRRIIFTGSAMPLLTKHQESGVGRWHTIRLATLSFYEYLNLRETDNFIEMWERGFAHELSSPSKHAGLPDLPEITSLQQLFAWSTQDFQHVADLAAPYVGHFHDYLLRGGFPQTAQIENISRAQQLLREDIIDKVLKRDMTALFGVRRILELERTFLYLCMHDGAILDMGQLCSNLALPRPTVQNFIDLLEATHLIYRLQPFGYGKEVLRGKQKIYLADPAMSSAVLMRNKDLLEDTTTLGTVTETAVFKHLFSHYRAQNIRFSYWQNKKSQEVDIVAEAAEQLIPFEIKYRAQHTRAQDLKGLMEFCQQKSIQQAYVVTRSPQDFGLLAGLPNNSQTQILRIPAPLLCYWMGALE
jgi:predicted AAA+ superfamily ATPase